MIKVLKAYHDMCVRVKKLCVIGCHTMCFNHGFHEVFFQFSVTGWVEGVLDGGKIELEEMNLDCGNYRVGGEGHGRWAKHLHVST